MNPRLAFKGRKFPELCPHVVYAQSGGISDGRCNKAQSVQMCVLRIARRRLIVSAHQQGSRAVKERLRASHDELASDISRNSPAFGAGSITRTIIYEWPPLCTAIDQTSAAQICAEAAKHVYERARR
jgi:hypothetical protein